MKILIYDNNLEDLKKFSAFIKYIPLDIELDKTNDHLEFKKLFEQKTYDTVFVDVNDENGSKLTDLIKKINPVQKTVTINNKFNCSEENGCDFCKTSFNKYRIVKPLNIFDITRALKDEPCSFDCTDDNLQIKLKVLSKPYGFLSFDSSTQIFTYSGIGDFFSQIINFTVDLAEHNIKYDVEDNCIKIHGFCA